MNSAGVISLILGIIFFVFSDNICAQSVEARLASKAEEKIKLHKQLDQVESQIKDLKMEKPSRIRKRSVCLR